MPHFGHGTDDGWWLPQRDPPSATGIRHRIEVLASVWWHLAGMTVVADCAIDGCDTWRRCWARGGRERAREDTGYAAKRIRIMGLNGKGALKGGIGYKSENAAMVF